MTRKSKETDDSSAVLATKPERHRCPDQLAHWAGLGLASTGSSGAASPGSKAACIALVRVRVRVRVGVGVRVRVRAG